MGWVAGWSGMRWWTECHVARPRSETHGVTRGDEHSRDKVVKAANGLMHGQSSKLRVSAELMLRLLEQGTQAGRREAYLCSVADHRLQHRACKLGGDVIAKRGILCVCDQHQGLTSLLHCARTPRCALTTCQIQRYIQGHCVSGLHRCRQLLSKFCFKLVAHVLCQF